MPTVSVPRPGGRWFKSNPRHQGKDMGSGDAPLQFFGLTTYWLVVRKWPHKELRLPAEEGIGHSIDDIPGTGGVSRAGSYRVYIPPRP